MGLVERFALDIEARGVSADRRRDQIRVLGRLGAFVSPLSLTEATGEDLAAFLRSRQDGGCAPGTLRKERQMALSFFEWAAQRGEVGAGTSAAMRAVARRSIAPDRTLPVPYSAKDLQQFREIVDRRWPLNTDDSGSRRSVERWRNGKGSYRRIRKHAIRLQLDAVISMALLGGLRRREIFGLGVNEMHYDNAYIVVWSGEPFKSSFREVPFTEAARTSVKAWLEFRALMGVEHDRPWLNLWAEKTALEAVKSHAFARLLSSYVSPGLSYRRLRHTCALSWLEAGLTLWEVQRLLGHSQLKDTLPFAEAMRSDLKERVGAVQGSIRSILVSAA